MTGQISQSSFCILKKAHCANEFPVNKNQTVELHVRDFFGQVDSASITHGPLIQPVVNRDGDNDADGTMNIEDNCLEIANGPNEPDAGGNIQRDTDGDGFGNVCDGDLNNDGIVNFADLARFKQFFILIELGSGC